MTLIPASGLRFIGRFQVTLVSFLQSFDVSGQDSTPTGVAFSPDGTSMFVIGKGSTSVHQYSLTTAFDLSTASFTGSSFDVSGQDLNARGVTFSPDGTSMFMIGNRSDSVHQYSLTTAFDLSTASFTGLSFDVSGQASDSTGIAVPTGVTFNPDGTSMFVISNGSDSVHQYSLTTAFDLSTASFTGSSFDVSGQDGEPTGVAFNPDGTSMFMIGNGSDSVHQYSLTTAFDLSTASFTGSSFDVSGQDSKPKAVSFSPDGGTMFIIGQGSGSVLQYIVGGVVPE